MGETPNEARDLLRQFEFPTSRWQERISVLSGGERRRLQILSVLSVVSCQINDEKKKRLVILFNPIYIYYGVNTRSTHFRCEHLLLHHFLFQQETKLLSSGRA